MNEYSYYEQCETITSGGNIIQDLKAILIEPMIVNSPIVPTHHSRPWREERAPIRTEMKKSVGGPQYLRGRG